MAKIETPMKGDGNTGKRQPKQDQQFTGQPGNIDVGGGRTYNPVTQQYGGGESEDNGNHYFTPLGDARSPQGAGDSTPDGNSTGMSAYEDWLVKQAANEARLRSINAQKIMEAQMAALGLDGLAGRITVWITEGYEGDAIMAMVRQSEEYANRFPAMKALHAKGQGISEQEYIAYEQAMVNYEKLYGLPDGMLSGKDMVTANLTAGRSAREIDERATRAAASIYQLPQEFRQQMDTYYGVSSGGLTAYFLDPDVATPLLEKQFVSAQIGMEATRQGIGTDRGLAESLYEFGIDRAAAERGFADTAAQRGLSSGKGETTDTGTLIDANLRKDSAAIDKVQRVAGGRVGRFAGGGGFTSGAGGVTGLGSSGA
jgi:hypothetical protein